SAAVHEHGVSGGSAVTFALPAGVQPGDLVAVYINTQNTIVPPTGWLQQRHDGEGSVWTQTLDTVPANLGSWGTSNDHGWTHTAVAFGGRPRVGASSGGGTEHN